MSQPSPKEVEALAQKLLAEARAESPDAEPKAKGLEALLSGQASPAPGGAPRPSGLPRRALVIVGSVALLVLVWWLFLRGVGPPPVTAVVVPATVTAPVLEAPPPVVEVPSAVEAPFAPPAVEVVAPAVEAAPAAAAVAVKPPPRPAAEEDPDLLARELKLLDQARTQLAGGEAGAAQRTLNGYRKSFPRGALRTEAQVVEIETLLKLGKRKEADALAKALLARERDGLLQQRVKRLLEGS